MAYYDKDKVFWMTAKRDGTCKECEDDIHEDDRIVWDSNEFAAYCSGCGAGIIGADPQQPRRHK